MRHGCLSRTFHGCVGSLGSISRGIWSIWSSICLVDTLTSSLCLGCSNNMQTSRRLEQAGSRWQQQRLQEALLDSKAACSRWVPMQPQLRTFPVGADTPA